jgi:hypothetical protein
MVETGDLRTVLVVISIGSNLNSVKGIIWDSKMQLHVWCFHLL